LYVDLTMDEILRERPQFSIKSSESQTVNGVAQGHDGRHADTVCVDAPHPELNGNDDWIDILILSWILLLCRGSLEQSTEDLTWGFSGFIPETSSPALTLQGGLNDVVTSETESISTALERIRMLRSSACEIVGDHARVDFVFAALHKTDVSFYEYNISVAPRIRADRLSEEWTPIFDRCQGR
jgi:hypothetical protein